jgi:hypothetical protein
MSAYSTSLVAKLNEFFAQLSLSPEDQTTLTREILRVIFKLPSSRNSIKLRSTAFKMGCLDELAHFKSMFLDISFYLNRIFWLETVKFLRENKVPSQAVKADLDQLLPVLLAEDIEAIKKIPTNDHLNVDHINLATWKTGQTTKRGLPAYAKSKMTRNYRYIMKHDPAQGPEDFEGELITEVVRNVNIYQRSEQRSLTSLRNFNVDEGVQQYVETALNNKVRAIHSYHNCLTRKRVYSTLHNAYQYQKRLKKLFAWDEKCLEISYLGTSSKAPLLFAKDGGGFRIDVAGLTLRLPEVATVQQLATALLGTGQFACVIGPGKAQAKLRDLDLMTAKAHHDPALEPVLKPSSRPKVASKVKQISKEIERLAAIPSPTPDDVARKVRLTEQLRIEERKLEQYKLSEEAKADHLTKLEEEFEPDGQRPDTTEIDKQFSALCAELDVLQVQDLGMADLSQEPVWLTSSKLVAQWARISKYILKTREDYYSTLVSSQPYFSALEDDQAQEKDLAQMDAGADGADGFSALSQPVFAEDFEQADLVEDTLQACSEVFTGDRLTRARKFIEIVTSDGMDPEFDAHVQRNNLQVDDLRKLIIQAKAFCRMTASDIKALRTVMTNRTRDFDQEIGEPLHV